MIFEHTCFEKESFRGWFKDGQSMEVSWPRTSIGLRVLLHDYDDGPGSCCLLWVGLGLIQFFIPLFIKGKEYGVGDEPSWGLDVSKEFGVVWYWGQSYNYWDWPFHTITLDRSFKNKKGGWTNNSVLMHYDEDGNYLRYPNAKTSTHDYTYHLQSGEVQHRKAAIITERSTRGRHILSKLGWPSRVDYIIDVEFDGEVGEETGSWKGGCIGCGYTMLDGETPLDTLERMERERKF